MGYLTLHQLQLSNLRKVESILEKPLIITKNRLQNY